MSKPIKQKRIVKNKLASVEEITTQLEKVKIEEPLILIDQLVSVDKEKEKDEIVKKITMAAYDKVHVYIFYAGNDCYVHSYIKNLQAKLDLHLLGSQVIIVSEKFVNNIGIKNCFVRELMEDTQRWTDFCLEEDKVCMIRFKSLPLYPIDMLFDYASIGTHEDDYVEIIEF